MKKRKVLPSPKDCFLICPVFFPLPDIHQKKNKVALCILPHIKKKLEQRSTDVDLFL